MKAIRYLAAALFLLDGILHFYFVTKGPSDPNFVAALAFGIIYVALGVFLILNKKFAFWPGFIIPILPLAYALFTVDFKTLDAISITILVCDVLVVICCLILLLNKNRS